MRGGRGMGSRDERLHELLRVAGGAPQLGLFGRRGHLAPPKAAKYAPRAFFGRHLWPRQTGPRTIFVTSSRGINEPSARGPSTFPRTFLLERVAEERRL